jgi:hypothetical protein
MQAVENYAVGECSVGESPATTSIVRIPEGPAVFSAPSKPNNPKKAKHMCGCGECTTCLRTKICDKCGCEGGCYDDCVYVYHSPKPKKVFSAPSKPNNPKKLRDSKPKTQKQCIKCDSPAVIHSFCADWCDKCWNAPIGEQPTTVRLSSGSIVHRAPTPVATKTKIKIIKKKQEQFLETFAGILQQHGMCVGCGNIECCKCN